MRAISRLYIVDSALDREVQVPAPLTNPHLSVEFEFGTSLEKAGIITIVKDPQEPKDSVP